MKTPHNCLRRLHPWTRFVCPFASLLLILGLVPASILFGQITPDGRTATEVQGGGSRLSVHTGTVAGNTGLNTFSLEKEYDLFYPG
ncbi:MAG: hypothetical protein ACFCU3_08450, partial [Verrucomicrobiales bacterium]